MDFTFRDQRLADVTTAMAIAQNEVVLLAQQMAAAAAQGQVAELQRLQMLVAQQQSAIALAAVEQQRLTGDRFDVSDPNALAVTGGMMQHLSPEGVALITTDPALLALGRALTEAEAQALSGLQGQVAQSPLEAMTAAGIDPDVARRVIGVALGHWLRQDPQTRDWMPRQVGVMLPLRLETMFEAGADGWTLLLRITPDEVSILRNSSDVTATEAGFLTEFWAGSTVGQFAANANAFEWLEHPAGKVAWQVLASRVTPQRASFLLETFPAHPQNAGFVAEIPADRVGKVLPPRIAGLPADLQVCVIDKAAGRINVGTLRPDAPDEDFRLPKSAADFDDLWLLSWPRAKQVGMGGEFLLPDGVTPQTIECLYVCGIGDAPPDAHFRAHADAGDLALMALGAPTNTVQGAPAAGLDTDAESWRIITGRRLSGEKGAGVAEIGSALCGRPDALPYLSGASHDVEDSQLLVAALWPALWGHFYRDIWHHTDDFTALHRWARQALYPEGPYLPLRIGAQPYGLLPVTSFAKWQASGDDLDAVEAGLIRQMDALIPVWAEAAHTRGTIASGDTNKLLQLLARPGVSANHVYRAFVNAASLSLAYSTVPDFVASAQKLWSPAADLMGQPGLAAGYLAAGFVQPLTLPLIGARRLLPQGMTLRDMAETLYKTEGDLFTWSFFGGPPNRNFEPSPMRYFMPQSLLIRLAMHSMYLVKAWLIESNRDNLPVVNPQLWFEPESQANIQLEQDQRSYRDVFTHGRGIPDVLDLAQQHEEAIARLFALLDPHVSEAADPLGLEPAVMQLALPPEAEAKLDRAFRATLDCAAHRIDAVATGIALRRLQQQVQSGNAQHRLGAYGWLDGPFVGQPGPTRAGRLHAPSRAQAITSLILRDKFLSVQGAQGPGARNLWQMNLSSAAVRMALALAEDVRAGFHIFEVVGRQVEGIIGGRHQILALRTAAPLRPDRPDLRDGCNGIAALPRLIGDDPIPGVLSDAPDIRRGQLEHLRALREALETFSDLLVAEGVHQVVSGHADLAADAMDAAAGFARPPEFEFTRTPPSGYRLSTSVLAALPYHAPGAATLPIEQADASLAAFLEGMFAGEGHWVWTLTRPDGTAEDVPLADLGLVPLETLLLSEDVLAEIARARLKQPDAQVVAPPAHRLMRQVAGLLGAPPSLAQISRSEAVSNAEAATEDLRQITELQKRYGLLADALTALKDEAPSLDDTANRNWLRRALQWGVLPALKDQPRSRLFALLWGGAEPDPADELAALVVNGKATLDKRLQAAPGEAVSPGLLARMISDLLLPGSRLGITVRWDANAFRAATNLQSVAPDLAVERDWLGVVAAVRPTLARLEAIQLETGILAAPLPKLVAWTNVEPDDDHWQTKGIADNTAQRETGTQLHKLKFGRFIAAFGPDHVWDGPDVALALMDSFSEAVPMPQRTTYAAFGFNAPASRPPQAILLAVPPRADGPLDPDTLIDILQATRQLLRARAVMPEDVVGHPIVPTMWFDAASAMRVRLDDGVQFFR